MSSDEDDSDYDSDDDSDEDSDEDSEEEEEEEEEKDFETAEVVREMTNMKDRFVEQEKYDDAKRMKLGIEQLKKLGVQITSLASQKRTAVQKEDYDQAKQLKGNMDELRGQVAASADVLRLGDAASRALSTPMMSTSSAAAIPSAPSVGPPVDPFSHPAVAEYHRLLREDILRLIVHRQREDVFKERLAHLATMRQDHGEALADPEQAKWRAMGFEESPAVQRMRKSQEARTVEGPVSFDSYLPPDREGVGQSVNRSLDGPADALDRTRVEEEARCAQRGMNRELLTCRPNSRYILLRDGNVRGSHLRARRVRVLAAQAELEARKMELLEAEAAAPPPIPTREPAAGWAPPRSRVPGLPLTAESWERELGAVSRSPGTDMAVPPIDGSRYMDLPLYVPYGSSGRVAAQEPAVENRPYVPTLAVQHGVQQRMAQGAVHTLLSS
jgi:hypothetical protein